MSHLHGGVGSGNQTPQCILCAPALTEAILGGGQQVVSLKVIGQSICDDPLKQRGQRR